jgi:hypothetical protein
MSDRGAAMCSASQAVVAAAFIGWLKNQPCARARLVQPAGQPCQLPAGSPGREPLAVSRLGSVRPYAAGGVTSQLRQPRDRCPVEPAHRQRLVRLPSSPRSPGRIAQAR